MTLTHRAPEWPPRYKGGAWLDDALDWTPADDLTLKKMVAAGVPISVASAHLGRGPVAIWKRAYRLRCVMPHEWADAKSIEDHEMDEWRKGAIERTDEIMGALHALSVTPPKPLKAKAPIRSNPKEGG